MAERTDSTAGFGDAQPGLERAKAIVAEFACATQSAILSLANEQKQRAAQQVGGAAEAVRAAARSLERSQSPTIARYADRAAEQIDELSRSLRARRWGEIIGDVEGVARQRPALFVIAAVAAGFLAGRFLAIPTHCDKAPLPEGALTPTEAVTAAVSSASGNGGLASWTDEGREPREMP
jgi:hypothetical protein